MSPADFALSGRVPVGVLVVEVGVVIRFCGHFARREFFDFRRAIPVDIREWVGESVTRSGVQPERGTGTFTGASGLGVGMFSSHFVSD